MDCSELQHRCIILYSGHAEITKLFVLVPFVMPKTCIIPDNKFKHGPVYLCASESNRDLVNKMPLNIYEMPVKLKIWKGEMRGA